MEQISIGISAEAGEAVRQLSHVNQQLRDMYQLQLATNKANYMMNTSTGGLTKQTGMLGGSLKGLALRFVGLQAAVNYAQQAFRGTIEYVKEANQKFRDFQMQMAEVSTILDEVGMERLPELKASIENMSVAFGKSVEDLSKGMYDILSAAVPVEQASHLLYIAGKTAIAGLSTVSQSVDILTSVLNSYRYSVAEMVHVSDVMFQSVVRGKFTFDELANALGYVTPIAAQAGVSFEDLSAAISTTTRFGQHIDMVSRGLALSIQNIIKPTKQAKDAAASYGIDLSLAGLKAQGFAQFINDLNTATRGNADAIAQIFPNMRSYRVMMVLAGNGTEEFTDDTELMSQSLGKADEAFTKMVNTQQQYINMLEQLDEQTMRTLGSMTQEFDVLGKKIDIFKGELLKGVISPASTGGISGLAKEFASFWNAPGGWLIGKITGASKETAKKIKYAEDMMDYYKSKARAMVKETSESVTGEKKGTLYERIIGGEDVKLAGYAQARHNFEKIATEYTEGALAIAEAEMKGENITAAQRIEVMKLADSYEKAWEKQAPFQALVSESERAMGDAVNVLDELQSEYTSLGEEIGTVGNMYDGTYGKELKLLEADADLSRSNHWVNLAMKDTSYLSELEAQNFDWLSDELKSHIKIVGNYTKEKKEQSKALKENNILMKENNIAIMELQLKGMSRRRGNTRAEERMIKKHQINNLKLQIDGQKDQLDIAKSGQEDIYNTSKEYIDNFFLAQEHNMYKLKDTYTEDINNLRNTIIGKEQLYENYGIKFTEAHSNLNNAISLHAKIAETYYGTEIPSSIRKTIDEVVTLRDEWQTTLSTMGVNAVAPKINLPTSPVFGAASSSVDVIGSISDLFSFQRGSYYVPKTGLAMVHRGEQLIPNGSNRGGDITINVNMPIENISSEIDIQMIADRVGSAIQSRMMNRDGTSKYRMR